MKDRLSDIKWSSYTQASLARCPVAEKSTPTESCINNHAASTGTSDPSLLVSTCASISRVP